MAGPNPKLGLSLISRFIEAPIPTWDQTASPIDAPRALDPSLPLAPVIRVGPPSWPIRQGAEKRRRPRILPDSTNIVSPRLRPMTVPWLH